MGKYSQHGKVVAIAGGFDPPHEGHLDHIRKASKLGDFLVVLVSTDQDMIRKKGAYFMRQSYRIELMSIILKGLDIKGTVIATIDEDGTQAKTIKQIKPDIFAKGGDRTQDNMPDNEVKACKEIGCEIVYGIGDMLNSSSRLIKDKL